MKEIEVKAKVRSQEVFLAQLQKLGIELSEPIVQKDICFAENLENYTEFLPNVNFLRLRQQDGKAIFTLKRSVLNETENTEHETEVTDPQELIAIINALGFKEAVRINKIRRTAKHQNFEICLDEIEDLGAFVELERLVETGNAEEIQEELFKFLETAGVSRADRVEQGYDTLMAIKKGVGV